METMKKNELVDFPKIDKENEDKKPKRIKIIPENIPQELKEKNTWCCWKWVYKSKKWTKPPCSPSGITGDHTKMEYTFDQVYNAYKKDKSIAGIGFSLRKTDQFCGIDIDNCIDDYGFVDKEAKKILKTLKSYCEISPSGKGIRIFGKGKIKTLGSSPKKHKLEMYTEGRYLTVTGQDCSIFSVTKEPYKIVDIKKKANSIIEWIFEDGFYNLTPIEKDRVRTSAGNVTYRDYEKDGVLIKDKIAISVMRIIDNFDCDGYETWLKVGMAIRTEFEDEKNIYKDERPLEDRLEKAFLIWCKWSEVTKMKYSADVCAEKWNSFSKNENIKPITLRSLNYIMGKENNISGKKAFEEFGDVSTSLSRIMRMQPEKREYILKPAIFTETCNMIHAPRGLGKTNFALSMAIAIATGGTFLDYKADSPKRVLYLDGELPEVDSIEYLQRACQLANESCDLKKYSKNFKMISSHSFPEKVFPQFVFDGMEYINGFCQQFQPDVLIIDSLATVFQWSDTKQSDWQIIQKWLISKRNEGVVVILIHHDNKAGTGQRGFSNKEDILNTVIHLQAAKGYQPELGACFRVHYSKSRGFYGADAKNKIVRICKDENIFISNSEINSLSNHGNFKWHVYEEDEYLMRFITDCFKMGLTLPQIIVKFFSDLGRVEAHKIVSTYRDLAVDAGYLTAEDIKMSKKGAKYNKFAETSDGYAKANPYRKKEQKEAKKEGKETRVFENRNEIYRNAEARVEKLKNNQIKGYYTTTKRIIKKLESIKDDSFAEQKFIEKMFKNKVNKDLIYEAISSIYIVEDETPKNIFKIKFPTIYHKYNKK